MKAFKYIFITLLVMICVITPVLAEDIISVGAEQTKDEIGTTTPYITETTIPLSDDPPVEEGGIIEDILDLFGGSGDDSKEVPVDSVKPIVPVEPSGDKSTSVWTASKVFDNNQWSKTSIKFSVINERNLDMSKIRFTNPDTLTEYKVNSISTNNLNDARFTHETTISDVDLTDYDFRRQGASENKNQWVVMYEDTDGIGHILRGNLI